MKSPLVSVIVLTKNSIEFIARVLDNLHNQTYKNIEIIVVDNFSTDDTVRISRIYSRRIYQKGPERTAQANYGIKKAYGEIIYVTGSDMTRDYNYVKKGVEKIQEGYDAVYASVLTDKDIQHFWGRVKRLERECYIGDNTVESTRFFKKSVWEQLGEFNEKLIHMEEDFQHRLDAYKFKTGRITAREYHLHEETNLKDVFKKSAYYGKYTLPYLQRHKWRGIRQVNPFRTYEKFLNHPILLGGLITYKIVQYGGALCGLLLQVVQDLSDHI